MKETITIIGVTTDAAAIQADERNKQVVFKNCALFTDRTRKINDTQVDNAKGVDVMMAMYNLLKYSDDH